MNMGNGALSTLAQAEITRSGLRYRYSRCSLCMGSFERLDGDDDSSDEAEASGISRCRNFVCGRMFHKKCLEDRFGSIGAKTCPSCQGEIQHKIVMVTPKCRERTPSR